MYLKFTPQPGEGAKNQVGQAASLLSESNLLPERYGHGKFELTKEEAEEFGRDDFEIPASGIPRPRL